VSVPYIGPGVCKTWLAPRRDRWNPPRRLRTGGHPLRRIRAPHWAPAKQKKAPATPVHARLTAAFQIVERGEPGDFVRARDGRVRPLPAGRQCARHAWHFVRHKGGRARPLRWQSGKALGKGCRQTTHAP